MSSVRIRVRGRASTRCLRYCKGMCVPVCQRDVESECLLLGHCLAALSHLLFVTMISDECIVAVRVYGWEYCLAAAWQPLFVVTPVNPDGQAVFTSLKTASVRMCECAMM